MKPRAVLVAHRAAMVAEGLAAGLGRFPGIVPVGVATTAAEGAHRGMRADAVAVDQYMQGAERLALSLRRGGVRVVMIGEAGDEEEEGVRISTHAPLSTLAAALAPEAVLAVPPSRVLTPRERQIIGLAAQGLAGKQIARQLGISPKTVERHKTRIFTKLGVSNQTAAVRAMLGGAGDREPVRSIDVRDFPSYRVTAALGTV